jgi:hypothetical protein
MTDLTIREMGEGLVRAFRLKTRPLAVYGADSVPDGATALSDVHRCFAAAMYRMAVHGGTPAIYAGGDAQEGCCPGGLTHMGLTEYPEHIKYFVSTGTPEFREGAAEYLKSSPEVVEKCFRAMGRVTSPGTYIVIRTCDSMPESDPGVRSISCFGTAEQIRNIGSLVHFDREEPFSPVIVPWGPVCATLITYPAGMAEKAPTDTAFMGPQDPTLNWALPEDAMVIGIPIGVIRRMMKNIDQSFIARRPTVAYPDRRRRDRSVRGASASSRALPT